VFTTLWSVKGGSGVTVLSAALAAHPEQRDRRTLLVDLCGDQPAALGVAEPPHPGLRDWLAAPGAGADALERLARPVVAGLALLPSGSASEWPSERTADLVAGLRRIADRVVVDAGVRFGVDGAESALCAAFADAGSSLLVTRPCYLSMRRAVSRGVSADGVVLVLEPGRALDRRDVADVLGLQVVASVEVDPAVARSVDAGLLVRRRHRVLERALRGLT
jgi:MinD-like ATPase involved in chromosome partitioning or flagellar assembly